MPLAKKLWDVAREYGEWATSDHPRIATGYSIVDSRTRGGIAQGEVMLFQARSAVGKTALGVNLIANNPQVPALFLSLEMAARYLVPRLAAIHTDTPTDQIYDDLRRDGRSSAVNKTVEDFPLFVVADQPAMSFKDMTIAMDEAEEEIKQRPQLVIIDFLELIGGQASLSDLSKVDALGRKAKDWARHNEVSLVILHQVGRGAGEAGHVPLDITSGRFGGEVSADYVVSAFRPCLRPGITQDEYVKTVSQYMIQFLKSRGGHQIHPEGIEHYMNPQTMRISEKIAMPTLFPTFKPSPQVVNADAEELGWEDDDYSLEPWSA